MNIYKGAVRESITARTNNNIDTRLEANCNPLLVERISNLKSILLRRVIH